jgi:hypothetical protein
VGHAGWAQALDAPALLCAPLQLGEPFLSSTKLKSKMLEQAKKRAGIVHTISHLGRWLALLVLLELIRMSATRRMMRSEPPERTFARVIMEVNKQPEAGQGQKPSKEYFPKPSKGSRKQSLHVITFDESKPKKSWLSLGSSKPSRAAAVEPKQQAQQQQPLRQQQGKPEAAKEVLQRLAAAKQQPSKGQVGRARARACRWHAPASQAAARLMDPCWGVARVPGLAPCFLAMFMSVRAREGGGTAPPSGVPPCLGEAAANSLTAPGGHAWTRQGALPPLRVQRQRAVALALNGRGQQKAPPTVPLEPTPEKCLADAPVDCSPTWRMR